jgi:sRNA-binding carbon storage regulator CsrA
VLGIKGPEDIPIRRKEIERKEHAPTVQPLGS